MLLRLFMGILLSVFWGIYPLYAVSNKNCNADSVYSKIQNQWYDFHEYWLKSKDKPDSVKIELWDELIEKKYESFLEDVQYRHYKFSLPEKRKKDYKKEIIEDFFVEFPKTLDFQKEFAPKLGKIINQINKKVAVQFPSITLDCDFYITIGIIFKGLAIYIGEKLSFVLAIDRFSNIEDLKVTIAHELIHLYHDTVIDKEGLKYKYKETLLFTVFTEGLAIYGSQVIYPELPGYYLSYTDKELEKNRRLLSKSASLIKENLLTTDRKVIQEFTWCHSENDTLPSKSAYYLGYLILREYGEGKLLIDIAKMGEKEILQLITDGVEKRMEQQK